MVDLQKFLKSTGQFCRAVFTSEKKPAAKHKHRKLTKRTSGVFRSGIQYKNLGAVKEAIASGERGEVGKLPWGEWETYPYVIQHKGARYIRLYPPHKRDENDVLVPDWDASHLQVEYYVDGEKVEKEVFNSYLTPSAARAHANAPHCITVEIDNVEVL